MFGWDKQYIIGNVREGSGLIWYPCWCHKWGNRSSVVFPEVKFKILQSHISNEVFYAGFLLNINHKVTAVVLYPVEKYQYFNWGFQWFQCICPYDRRLTKRRICHNHIFWNDRHYPHTYRNKFWAIPS